MTNIKFVFLCLLAITAARSEFLFDKNTAANDKFMCLHQKLYRREKPAVKSNPARILSMMRNLQALYPSRMPQEYQTDFNGMVSYLSEGGRFPFIISPKTASSYATALSGYRNIDDKPEEFYLIFFKSDDFKKMVADAVLRTYDNFKLSNQLAIYPVSSTTFVNAVLANTKTSIDYMMTEYLKQYNIDQAKSDGIQYNKLVYVMLNILELFREDANAARTAYEDYYSLNKDQVVNSDTINSAAVIRWIESIKTRYQQLRAAPTPDAERLIEPFEDSGSEPIDVPSGNYLEPVNLPAVPNPPEINENEPPTIDQPVTNPLLLIPDMIIEIQRTYNVYRMLLAYNQLPQAMRDDIDSCKLNLAPAMQRCEAMNGSGNCEAISGTMVAKKCPTGYVRQGCCKCVVECDASEFYTTDRAFCAMKSERHQVPNLSSAASAPNTSKVNSGMNLAMSSCGKGFGLNKFICYKTCPAGTRPVGGALCLKTKPVILGAPYMWTAGDE